MSTLATKVVVPAFDFSQIVEDKPARKQKSGPRPKTDARQGDASFRSRGFDFTSECCLGDDENDTGTHTDWHVCTDEFVNVEDVTPEEYFAAFGASEVSEDDLGYGLQSRTLDDIIADEESEKRFSWQVKRDRTCKLFHMRYMDGRGERCHLVVPLGQNPRAEEIFVLTGVWVG